MTGIDAMLATAVWSRLSPADADATEAFFEARAGWQAFTYQLPGTPAPRKWVCTSWQVGHPAPHRRSITAEFREVLQVSQRVAPRRRFAKRCSRGMLAIVEFADPRMGRPPRRDARDARDGAAGDLCLI